MRQTQPSPSGPIQSFIQNYYMAQWLMQFPALTVMVWLMWDLGYRMVSPARLPESLRYERRLERFADPFAIGVIGYAVVHFSPPLGCWLLLSAVCLRCYEWAIHMRDLNLNMDILDGMIRSEQQNQTVEEFETQSGWHKNAASGGLPTGLSDDIESQITISVKQRRGNNKNKNTIDI